MASQVVARLLVVLTMDQHQTTNAAWFTVAYSLIAYQVTAACQHGPSQFSAIRLFIRIVAVERLHVLHKVRKRSLGALLWIAGRGRNRQR